VKHLFLLSFALIMDSTLPNPISAQEVVRVGLIQMDGREFDNNYNLSRVEALIRAAATRGAGIVCTPEVAVQGYPRVHLELGTSAGDPKIAQLRARILAAAETIPGPATDRFSRLARELGLWVVFGMDENRAGELFNVAVLVSPQGDIAGKYSKVHLQDWMVASGVNHGEDFPVWEVEIRGVRTKIGIEICYDVQHPESTRELALGGAEIVFVPYCTSDFSRPLLIHLFETRALENRVFLVRVNFADPRNSGTSSIIDFEGSTLEQLDRAENILVRDVNLTELRKTRASRDNVYSPSYRQPTAYKGLRAELEGQLEGQGNAAGK
jgi:predicted amidohydrolase